MGEARFPLRQAGQFQSVVEPAVQVLRKLARVKEEQEKCTRLEQVEHFSESLPTSRLHEVDVVDKSQVVVGGTLREGVEGTQTS